ncbi:unnamed protein product, partial [Amoebophrya sp. A25]|eukprot:GSA25T00003038001.1
MNYSNSKHNKSSSPSSAPVEHHTRYQQNYNNGVLHSPRTRTGATTGAGPSSPASALVLVTSVLQRQLEQVEGAARELELSSSSFLRSDDAERFSAQARVLRDAIDRQLKTPLMHFLMCDYRAMMQHVKNDPAASSTTPGRLVDQPYSSGGGADLLVTSNHQSSTSSSAHAPVFTENENKMFLASSSLSLS